MADMDLHWDDVRFLLSATRAGSIVGAARELSVQPSTASRRLDRLESALGGELFLRTSEGLVPTDLCARTLPAAERIEHEFAGLSATASASQTVDGIVRVAIVESMAEAFIYPNLDGLLERHPRIQIEVVASTALVDIGRGEADLAVRLVKDEGPELVYRHLANVSSRAYIHERVWERCLRAADGGRLEPRELPWVGLGRAFDAFPEARWLQTNAGVPPVLRVSSYAALFRAVCAGAGAGVLPDAYASTGAGLVPVPLGFPPVPNLEVWIVTHRALRRSPRIQAVWDWLVGLIHDLVNSPTARHRIPPV